VPQVARLGCAGMILILIAALTSVGLYAVVAGGVPWAGTGARSSAGGAQVLVTIQAGPAPPTSAAASTTPATVLTRPPSTSAAPAQPSVAPAPAAAAPTPADSRPATTVAPPGQAAPAAAASATPLPSASATSAPADATAVSPSASLPGRASHEGLALEIVEVERGWQVRGPDGSVVQRRDGSELVTVHVRLSNEASELRYLADTDLVLVADDGARLAPRQTPPLREPHLLTVPVAPHDSVRGWLTFDVPAGLEPRRLQWSPTRPDRPRAEATYLLALPR